MSDVKERKIIIVEDSKIMANHLLGMITNGVPGASVTIVSNLEVAREKIGSDLQVRAVVDGFKGKGVWLVQDFSDRTVLCSANERLLEQAREKGLVAFDKVRIPDLIGWLNQD